MMLMNRRRSRPNWRPRRRFWRRVNRLPKRIKDSMESIMSRASGGVSLASLEALLPYTGGGGGRAAGGGSRCGKGVCGRGAVRQEKQARELSASGEGPQHLVESGRGNG